MWYFREFGYYPPSRPRQAKGGIRAQSRRGGFGESWWAKRWIAVLESFQLGARLGRGRSYARNGQVLEIDIRQGAVKAKVQGSRPKPYAVTIEIETLDGDEWDKVIRQLGGEALYTAKLLAGEMPTEVETAFEKAGVSLFPTELEELQTECSCPDWSNPCKHIAAVYYLIGEEFDRDPFLLFKLRGLSREELFRKLSRKGRTPGKRLPSTPTVSAPAAEPAAEPLPAEPERFWSSGTLPADWLGQVQPPPVQAPLLKRLGSFPFWRGRERFLETLEPMYRLASPRGLEVVAGLGGRNEDQQTKTAG